MVSDSERASERRFNFSSGPAMLPEEVLRRAQAAIWDLDHSGIGVLEHSHRGAAFMKVAERAERVVRDVGGVPDDYAVLFLQGGASSQFFMVPMNLLPAGATADYCNTGVWSQKAIGEARRLGKVHVACSSEASAFDHIPGAAETSWSASPAYAHFTSNNTIYGTEWTREPEPPAGVPLVCDASSDLFSRPIDLRRYGLVYAGAQKNLGIAGLTLVIARRDLIAGGVAELPTMLSYRTHELAGSMHNTPPTFAIYVLAEVVGWIAAQGGLAAMAERNQAKARVLYDFLDGSAAFRGVARADSRSLMNVTFRAATPALERKLLARADERGLDGLAGHRTVGGLRASIYNAFPLEGVERLVELLAELEDEHRSGAHAGS
ncbi:MAG TPA: 3-phosphoserine/phosphohydroxythreonine transaminase [Kofleriaceae bacterium]|nr:3-phosphoserine/phosphohydroxythreonine transaminase [Kofleriaceae bacterium]